MTNPDETILVTGATGSVGRLVVDALVERGATDVRALTVDPARAALPSDVQPFVGSLRRPHTMAAALEGVDRMYLAPLEPTVDEVMAMAVAAGVDHVVDLAGPEGSWWHSIEVAVEASGLTWTHLEAGEFMENATVLADQIRRTGQVREAYPEAANAMIAMADIASVAATALLGDGHRGRAYELTGPTCFTRREMVGMIGAALGREIEVLEVTPAEAAEALTPSMGEYAAWYVDGQASMVDHPQSTTTTVADVTGRPATDFATWLKANVADFR